MFTLTQNELWTRDSGLESGPVASSRAYKFCVNFKLVKNYTVVGTMSGCTLRKDR